LLPASSGLLALMMEVESSHEMLVNFYWTTQRNKPEDSHLHTCHGKNLISYKADLVMG
jgi:hypothetical protein